MAGSLQAPTSSLALIPMLHIKQKNSIQKTSLVGERVYLVHKQRIDCRYDQCETSLIPYNGFKLWGVGRGLGWQFWFNADCSTPGKRRAWRCPFAVGIESSLGLGDMAGFG
ncbi:hypothetical protein Hanom_Chr16g01509111 [Helianthus anomalus]